MHPQKMHGETGSGEELHGFDGRQGLRDKELGTNKARFEIGRFKNLSRNHLVIMKVKVNKNDNFN